MGVRGLKTFIEKNEHLFEQNYQLHNTYIVVDANNLISVLARESQHERRDLFGGDMVLLGRHIAQFFENLKKCAITPILVFDGAQTYVQGKSKTAEKHKRALDRLNTCMSISESGRGDFILPISASNVFRSVAIEKSIEIIQCMYEADIEVARIAHKHKCPVVSNDSDFFLINLPYGMITIDRFKYNQVLDRPTYKYIECWLFEQRNFARYIPELDVRNLPLLGVLVGNDFVDGRVFEQVCGQLPLNRILSSNPSYGRQFKHGATKQHFKILKVLHFLCAKSMDETINQICAHVAKQNRMKLKAMIKASLENYNIPPQDDFEKELFRLYRRGFMKSNRRSATNSRDLDVKFEENLQKMVKWLRYYMEHSVLSYRCLELANKNIVFILGHMEDPQLDSAHVCQHIQMSVMMAIMKAFPNDSSPTTVYDRIGTNYRKFLIEPTTTLEGFGDLSSLTFFQLPTMSASERRLLLLATFHSSSIKFDRNKVDLYYWLEADHAEEFLTIKILMNFIDNVSRDAKLWKHFRQSTLLCILYHHFTSTFDQTMLSKLSDDRKFSEFIEHFRSLIRAQRLNRMPALSKRRPYNCRLMHQITQLHSTIICFNGLNALLGDTMVRIRQEHWLNSCLIYNIAEGLHYRTLRLLEMPNIVHNIPKIR